MEKIKNLIFKLIEKKPSTAYIHDFGDCYAVNYYHNSIHVNLSISKNDSRSNAYILIEKDCNVNTLRCELSDREYLKIMCKIMEWREVLEEEAIEDLSEFVNSPNGSMDDLLND